MKFLYVLAAALTAVFWAASASADHHEGEAEAAAPQYSTSTSTISDLMANPDTKAVLEKHIPQLISNPQFEQAGGFTLKDLQGFSPESFPDELLAAIDADLAAITS
jgi:para-nitrobenzyl esterase